MKSLRILLALGMLACLAPGLSAQEFGRGKFLKRIREEISEANKQREEKQKKARAEERERDRERDRLRRERERDERAGKGARTPTLPKPPGQPPSFAPQDLRGQPVGFPRSRNRDTEPEIPAPRGISAATRNGFGLEVQDRDGKLIVTRVAPRGNAAEAGIRNGDVLVGVGGIDIETEQDFEEFTKILGAGDQMEFSFLSRGKPRKANVTFGEIPDVGEEPGLEMAPGDGGFVPPIVSANGAPSVLEGPRSLAGARDPDFPRDRSVNVLQQTISRQQQEIEALRNELMRIRQQNPSNRRNNGTSLNGPGN